MQKLIERRNIIFDFALKTYGVTPEYLWKDDPYSAVLRHPESKKWFGILMVVSADKLGVEGNSLRAVINVKVDAETASIFRKVDGFLPAYHMNKEKWITVLIDEQVEKELIFSLIDNSYNLVSKRNKK